MEPVSEEHSFYESAADGGGYFNFHSANVNRTPAHFHSNMEIIFVRKGGILVSINGEERKLRKGDIALSNGFDVHYYYGDSDSQIYVLVFSNSYMLNDIAEDSAFENFYLESEHTEEIFDFIDFFYCRIKPDTIELRSSLVNAVMGMLRRIHAPKRIDKRGSANFHEILSYINKNINEDISCESVAGAFGFTKNYFSMLFNKYTGMHFRSFVNRLRLKEVQSEVDKNSEEPITKIVLRCGFQSLNTYYRALCATKE